MTARPVKAAVIGGNDHLVARTDVERAQRQGDGVGAVADADGESRTARRGELGLERLDLGPRTNQPGIDDARDRRRNLRRRLHRDGDQ